MFVLTNICLVIRLVMLNTSRESKYQFCSQISKELDRTHSRDKNLQVHYRGGKLSLNRSVMIHIISRGEIK